MNSKTEDTRAMWTMIIAAATIMVVTMGIRQVTGLFVSPINTSTQLGIVKISLAMAVAQFMWGASQPIFGAFADKYGATPVIIFGALLLGVGTAATPFVHTEWGLMLTLGILSACGAGAGSFSILIGGTAQRLPADKRGFAAGFINAGGSFGQFVFAPLTQAMISAFGWVSAMLALAATTVVSVPLAWVLRRPKTVAATTPASSAPGIAAATTDMGLRRQLAVALRDRSYLYLHAGFFTCGFHIAFLITHLPGEVALCNLPASVSATAIAVIGLFNIAGSLIAGSLTSKYRMKNMLALIYAARGVIILLYLLAPKTTWTFYIFAAALGITWLATIPPTAGIVGKLFGMRYMGTLFGLTLLSHQIGGFFGAYLGGLTIAHTGNYTWMWYADIALAFFAALVNLPIREAKVVPRSAPRPA